MSRIFTVVLTAGFQVNGEGQILTL